jgi:hypothetical protein
MGRCVEHWVHLAWTRAYDLEAGLARMNLDPRSNSGSQYPELDIEQNRIRCLGHIINLIVQAFLLQANLLPFPLRYLQ